MKKKLIALVLSAIMAAGILGGCGKSGGGVQEVDFWSAPNQGQYDYWVEKAEAFNATKTEVNGKVIEKMDIQKIYFNAGKDSIKLCAYTGFPIGKSRQIQQPDRKLEGIQLLCKPAIKQWKQPCQAVETSTTPVT